MFEKLKAKLEGARKSLTVITIAAWQAVIQNTDAIQTFIPQLPQYFSQHLVSIISGIFGALLLYIRIFRTNGPVEDKVMPKDGQ